MTYLIRLPTLTKKQNPIEIDKTMYDQAILAKKDILAGVQSERCIGILVLNYQAFENLFLSVGVYDACAGRRDQPETDLLMIKADRSINNLLSSCRMLIDQNKHALEKMFGKDSYELKGWYSQYQHRRKDTFEFELLENCRNVAQHESLLVGGLTFSGVRHFLDEDVTYRELSTRPQLNIDALRGNKRIRSSLIKDLEERKETDLRVFVRAYIEQLWELHKTFRSAIETRIVPAREIIEQIYQLWENENGKDERGVGLYLGDSGTRSTDGEYISRKWTRMYDRMLDQWRLDRLHEVYVSSHPNLRSLDLRK